MRATILVCALMAASACCAFAQEVNVIYQHNPYYDDPHNPAYPFYRVFPPPANNVEIYHGVEGQTFIFEAVLEGGSGYHPGVINSITAVPNAGTVTLTVVGWDGHPYGAADIGEINLDATGVVGTIAAITIQGDYGAVGPMKAASAGALAIGGLVQSAVQVADITGPVTIKQLGAELHCRHMQDLTVQGPTPEGYPLPNITVEDSYAYPYEMQISQDVGSLAIAGEVSGLVHITSDLSDLDVGTLPGSVTIDGNLLVASIGSIAATGSLDVGNDLGGGEGYPLAVSDLLEGTVTVRNDLLAGHVPGYPPRWAWVHAFGSEGTLRVQRDSTCPFVAGEVYMADPLPTEASISVGVEGDGMLLAEIDVYGDVVHGSIIVNDQDDEHCVHVAYGDLAGTIQGIDYLACVTVDESILPGGSVVSDCQLVGPLSVGAGMDGTIFAPFVDASITVGGHMDGLLTAVRLAGSFYDPPAGLTVQGGFAGTIQGEYVVIPVEIDGLFSGQIIADDANCPLWSDIVVSGDMLPTGSVTAAGNLSGSFQAGALGGAVAISGDLDGLVGSGAGSLTGSVWIGGNLAPTGVISVPVTPFGSCTSGTIKIEGDMMGTIDLPVLCDQAGDLSQGHIIVNGAFGAGGYIHLSEHLTGTAFFTCDFDGWDEGDEWSGGEVAIDNQWTQDHFYANTPGEHLWHTSWVRGDVNNDSPPDAIFPDFTDINPFVLALSNKVLFAHTYPGLALVDPNAPDGPSYTAGPVLYTGDCNCDGSFNMGDINPFVALINHHPDPNCPGYPAGDQGMNGDTMYEGGDGYPPGLPSPEELAAQLAANVAPELYDNLLFVIAGAIEMAQDEQTQAYWEAVYAILTQ